MLTIGSRGSALALAQTHWVRGKILERRPDLDVRIRVIRTSADRDAHSSIRSFSGTGVFVKEIEEALLAGDIDLAVHSMKDVPTKIPEGLEIGVVPEREDVRDALLTDLLVGELGDLPEGAVVGTGSLRRKAQILALRPDVIVREIRGNVDTRLEKLRAGDYQAILLACAGLRRLGFQDRITAPLDLREMLPAPGQGALALETRRDDARARECIQFLQHEPTAAAVTAEREFLRRMGGGCNSPIAVHAEASEEGIRIEGLVATEDGRRIVRESVRGGASSSLETGSKLAEIMLSKGARELLERSRPTEGSAPARTDGP